MDENAAALLDSGLKSSGLWFHVCSLCFRPPRDPWQMGPLGCNLLDGSHSLQDYSVHRVPLTQDVLEVLAVQEHLADQQDLEVPSYHSQGLLGHLREIRKLFFLVLHCRGYLSIQMSATRRLPGAPGGPVSPASPIPLSPLSPFGPWGPTDKKTSLYLS